MMSFELGSLEEVLSQRPLPIFEDSIIEMLSTLSSQILKESSSRDFPALMALGFWLRKGNLINQQHRYVSERHLFGRGLSLHFPPSNVPLNTAYSLVLGLVSGNTCLIRLPSQEHLELEMFVDHLTEVLSKDDFRLVKRRICLVRYPHDEVLTGQLSLLADARVIWGGDASVSSLRRFPTKPRCVDLCFADRISLTLLHGESVEACDDSALRSLCDRFYADSYTFSQNACSSPRLVVWHGATEVGRSRFWNELNHNGRSRRVLPPIQITDRFVALSEYLASSAQKTSVTGVGSVALRLAHNNATRWPEAASIGSGTFSETLISELSELAEYLSDRVQTISYFGYSDADAVANELEQSSTFFDRLVPIGEALSFDFAWDGYDSLRMITHKISVI